MNTLIQHIESLLPDHDCVVVPGLGGFVQNEISARFDHKADMFYPEGKEICFNARLTFNDGVLVQSYQESTGLSFEESNSEIRLGVQELKYKIDEGKYVSLGRIGVMWKNEQGQLAFRSENKNFFIPDAYGLSSFAFPNLEKRHRKIAYSDYQTKKRKNDEFINIRLRRNSFRNFVTAAAACLLMLLISKPAGNLPGSKNQEAFLLHNYLAAPTDTEQNNEEALTILDEPIPEVDKKEVVEAPVSVDKYVDEDTIADNLKNKKQEEFLPAKHKTVKKAAKSSDHTYYVIIGSFPDNESAKEWMKIQGRGGIFKYSGILEKDGRARVYTRNFPDKDNAESFLEQFRANNPEYASAWLLSIKNN